MKGGLRVPKVSRNQSQKIQRAHGRISATFRDYGGLTRLQRLDQNWPGRVLFPSVPGHSYAEAVITNIAGGMVSGDQFDQNFELDSGADVTLTSQSAEKIYRSHGAPCRMTSELTVGPMGCLEWMPQETILFEGAQLHRSTRFNLHENASLLAGEMTVFGRRARGETFHQGKLNDHWEILRNGKLVFSDRTVVGTGYQTSILTQPFAFNEAAAMALMVCQAPDLVIVRDCGRQSMGPNALGGFTIVNGLVIGRFVSDDAARLRDLISKLWTDLRQAMGFSRLDLPRVWKL